MIAYACCRPLARPWPCAEVLSAALQVAGASFTPQPSVGAADSKPDPDALRVTATLLAQAASASADPRAARTTPALATHGPRLASLGPQAGRGCSWRRMHCRRHSGLERSGAFAAQGKTQTPCRPIGRARRRRLICSNGCGKGRPVLFLLLREPLISIRSVPTSVMPAQFRVMRTWTAAMRKGAWASAIGEYFVSRPPSTTTLEERSSESGSCMLHGIAAVGEMRTRWANEEAAGATPTAPPPSTLPPTPLLNSPIPFFRLHLKRRPSIFTHTPLPLLVGGLLLLALFGALCPPRARWARPSPSPAVMGLTSFSPQWPLICTIKGHIVPPVWLSESGAGCLIPVLNCTLQRPILFGLCATEQFLRELGLVRRMRTSSMYVLAATTPLAVAKTSSTTT
ncbi:uncharacterized protein BDR25DRAFT_393060, partial [Lindgomyces ingoldianus]